jgi:hypothetical protein
MRMMVIRTLLAFTLVAGVLTTVGLTPSMAQAATPAEIDAAIEAGLQWLAAHQNADGSWVGGYNVARTGLAVLKFETHATFMGMSPFDPAYVYSGNVQAGLDYIFNNCHSVAIGLQDGNDPDTNGNGIGVKAHHPGNSSHEMYEVGIALMAISASQSPDRVVGGAGSQAGRRYEDVAQDIVDFIAWAQRDAAGCSEGGWRYTANYGDSDNSISGYVTLGLHYAVSGPPWGFGLTVPAWVYGQLNTFVGNVQDPVNGEQRDGGSWYVPCASDWVNILKTGNLLSEMALVGDTQATGRVQDALDYMERHWNDPNPDPGWKGFAQPHYQACFTTMKGFQALGIEEIEVGGSPVNWYDEMADAIVNSQNPDGSWPVDSWGDSQLTTCWAMLTLQKAAPPALELEPAIDTNPVGTDHTVNAIYKVAGEPQAGVQINFEVTAGPNAGDSGTDITNASGVATFTYTGDGGAGTDTIVATAVDASGAEMISARATKEWTAPSSAIPAITGWGIAAAVLGLAAVSIVSRRKLARQSA